MFMADEPDLLRREFAAGWGRMGAGWGIAPSTATVQGFFLLHGGPLTEAELREAIGLSHKAAFGAIADCEAWGLIEPATPQRSGQRGPAGRAWVVTGDHWEWFRRVAASRLERETAPIVPLVDDCLARSRAAGDARLTARLEALSRFAHDFDRSARAVTGADSAVIGRLAGVLARLDREAAASLLAALAEVPDDELAAAADRVARLRPVVLRRLLRLAVQPGVSRLLDRLG
jgi:DNA-binding transcriptional regulator GbsR (MarR family)